MEKILNTYYANNARKLHNTVDKILLQFGGVPDKDVDDFYSLANEVFVDVMRRYECGQSFDRFLYSCLSNKIKTEITARNRYKRRADRMSISMDAPVGDENETVTLGDMIADRFDMDIEIFGEMEEEYSKRMILYLNKLSKMQKEILRLMIAGYNPSEIQEELHISKREYADGNLAIHSYRNVSVLFD